jgi:class 3 adenylate cyclase
VQYGLAFVGSFGGPMRSDYTAIGDIVNLASRIQAEAEPDQILLSEEMARYISVTAHRRQGIHPLKAIRDTQALYLLEPWLDVYFQTQQKLGRISALRVTAVFREKAK